MGGQKSSQGLGLLLVVLATAVWSTSGIFINFIVNGSGISPWGLAFWRDLSTFVCLLAGLALFRRDLLRVNRRDLPWLGAMGAISIGLFHVLWITSVMVNGVAVSTVIQCNGPVIVTIVAWLLWREPLTRNKIAAIVLAFIGTVLISRLDGLGQAQITTTGLLIALSLAVAYSGLSLFGKKLAGDYNPWTVLVYIFGFAALTLLPFQIGVSTPWPISPDVLGYFAAWVLLPTILGFWLYNSSLHHLQASVASIVATLEVPFAAIVSYITLGERLDGWQILGAALVVSGVILLSLPQERLQEVSVVPE
jgi:DME family drug/metabolite transporter